jgi:hypothetical protein
MVAITTAPGTDALLRRAARIAFRYNAELEIVHAVVDDTGLPGDHRSTDDLRELAADLGAHWHVVVRLPTIRAFHPGCVFDVEVVSRQGTLSEDDWCDLQGVIGEFSF